MLNPKNKITAVVLGAGSGRRMSAGKNKLFLRIKHIPILYRTLYRLDQIDLIASIILVHGKDDRKQIDRDLTSFVTLSKLNHFVIGGKERADSVRLGLKKALEEDQHGLIMTHDGARPFITESLVERLVNAWQPQSVVIPVQSVVETVRRKEDNGKTSIVDRTDLFAVQTPQLFSKEMIAECFFDKGAADQILTDEASYFERAGKPVTMVQGEKWNIKLTTPADLKWADSLLHQIPELQLKGLE